MTRHDPVAAAINAQGRYMAAFSRNMQALDPAKVRAALDAGCEDVSHYLNREAFATDAITLEEFEAREVRRLAPAVTR